MSCRVASCAAAPRRLVAATPARTFAVSLTRASGGGAASGGGGGAPAATPVSVTKNDAPGIKGHRDHPYLTKAGRYLPGFSFPAPRRLEDIIKYALVERETPAAIRKIWTEFHDARADCVASVLDVGVLAGFKDRARRFPFFVFPVFRGDGQFFTLLSQFQDNHCIFTFLDDYKRNPALAEPYLAVTFFEELATRKGLVLVRGDFSGHLKKSDAEALMRQLEHFYLREPSSVETFNRDSSKFDFNKHMLACKTI